MARSDERSGRAPILARILDLLEKRHGKPKRPPARGAFEIILYENVAYLVSDERRDAAFQALKSRIGTSMDAILAAPPEVLKEVAKLGGPMAEGRVGKLRTTAALALERFGGDLDALLRGPVAVARKGLKEFPGIGDPGADRILLFTGVKPLLALDSNALRALVRLGFGEEKSG